MLEGFVSRLLAVKDRDKIIGLLGPIIINALVDITPPFPADPQALGTTLLEGGEDDTGRTGMQEEVQPNFRTPPSY